MDSPEAVRPEKRWQVTVILQGEREMGEYEAETEDEVEAKAWADMDDADYVTLCGECSDLIDGISVVEMQIRELES